MSALGPTPLSGPVPCRQRGVVLLVALIILVALSLAGVALIRSVDTGNLIAGNLSFHQSAVLAGEKSAELALTNWLLPSNVPIGNTALHNESPANGYFAIRNDRLVTAPYSPGNPEPWETYWNRVATTPVTSAQDAAGNTVAYVIHRLCATNGAPFSAGCAKQPSGTGAGGSQSPGSPVMTNNQVYYRVTTRITGPRNTVAYIQTIVAL